MILGVTVVMAGLAVWFWWPKGGSERQQDTVSNRAGATPPKGSAGAKSAPADFSHLPPQERIMAETKRSVEEAAAWREKLRKGNYSTLPPEAYPPGVPPPAPPPPAQ